MNENIIDEPTPSPTPTPKPGLEPDETDEPTETDNPENPNETDNPDATDNPSETGKPTDKPTNTDKPIPTINPDDGSEVIAPDYSYKVSVRDNDGVISGAIVSVNKENGNVTVKLPVDKAITPDNRIIVGVANADNAPISGIPVAVISSDGTQASDKTNTEGIAIVPPTNTDRTDKDGYAQVIEGENSYNVIVADETEKIENAVVTVSEGKISVILPDANTLDTSNQTTVTVTDKDNQPVKDMSVTVTDKNAKTATKATDANGKITVPVKATSSGGGGGSSSGGSGGGGGSSVSSALNVKVTDKDGKTVSVTKSVKDNKVTLTLPTGKVIDDGNYYTITVTDSKGSAKADIEVTLKDKKDGTATGTTDKDGKLTLPALAAKHSAYIVGYPDGTFMPDGDMSRAEAAAIFARLIAEEKGESISGKSSFSDVDKNGWYVDYIGYLAKYKVIEGYEDGTFRPDASVTRAEFVSMAVRYYSLFNEVNKTGYTVKYTDVSKNYWAYTDIAYAKNIGWLNGYADGTFKGDNNITRAEVVTVTNRATGRTADKDFISANVSTLNKFTDLKNNTHWAYYEIMEAANTHKAVSSSDAETWVK